MPTYEIVVTDVTCYGTLYCVAGWDRRAGRMIRPEPPAANMASEASKFWDGRFAGPGRTLSIGNIVRVEASPPPPDFPFPHATEDRIVAAATQMQVLGVLDLPGTVTAVAAGVSPMLEGVFDDALIRPLSGKGRAAALKSRAYTYECSAAAGRPLLPRGRRCTAPSCR